MCRAIQRGLNQSVAPMVLPSQLNPYPEDVFDQKYFETPAGVEVLVQEDKNPNHFGISMA